MSHSPTTRLEDLLSHADWLKRLATHLVRGGAEAGDLMQDTWETALRHPPDPARPAQPWLAEVLRNLVRSGGRKRRLHQRFVAQAPPPAAVPPPELLVERAEAQRFVAQLVIALPEPYRGTVLLRYYEGLSGAQIATALAIPPGTVRWRLKEGLDRVRAGLSARYGSDRDAWSVVLLPVAATAARAPAAMLEGAVLMAKTKLGVVLGIFGMLALLGGAIVWRTGRPGPRAEHPPAEPRLRSPAPGTARPRAVLEAWARAGGGQAGDIAGMVRDLEGRPVKGARVALVVSAAYEEIEDRTALRPRGAALSADDGSFRFSRVAPGIYLLTATAEGWAPAERTDVVLLPAESITSIELRLGNGAVKLRGTVSDAGGGPVAGGAIRALALGAGRRPDGARTFLAATDGGGRYEIHLSRGSYLVVADADGYVPTTIEVRLDLDQNRDFRLLPAALISGRVVEAGGAPVAGALVRLESDALIKPEARSATADRAGRFVFSNVAPGGYRLSARSGDLVGRAAGKVTVGFAEAATELLIELVRGLAIAGKVVDRNGAPVPGAQLRLNPERATAVAAADGRYRLAGLPPGRHTVSAEAAGHAPSRTTVSLDRADREGIDLTLGAQSTIDGRVLGRDGAPIAGASVTALVVAGDALGEVIGSAAVSRSDEAGRFHLAGLGAGDVRVEAEQAASGRGVAGPFPLAEGATREIEIRLGSGGMIRGTVSWDDRSPATNVLAGGHQRGRPGSSTVTDGEGRYEVGPFTAGEVSVSARPEIDPLGAGGETRRVTLAAGEDRDGVDLVIPRHDLEISGMVLGPDGAPLPGATVGASSDHNGVSWRPYNKYARGEAGNYTVLSDADGTFTVKHLPRGTYTIWATQPGLPEADAFRVAAGSRGVRLKFTSAATLAGRVVSSSGAPVTTYTLHALLGRTNDATPELRAAAGYVQDTETVQNPAGAFEVTGLHPAVYDVLVTTPGGLGGRITGIALGPGQAKRDVRVSVRDAVRVKGRVVDADTGHPLADVAVVAWLAMLREQVAGRSDATGAFVLDGVVPGTIDLSLRGAPGTRRVASHSITVPDGAREVDAGTLTLGARPR